MQKTGLILFLLLCVAANGYAQFNTVTPPKEAPAVVPTLATQANRVIVETGEQTVFINDKFADQRREIFNRRKFFSLPIDSMVINSPYGMRTDPIDGTTKMHKGIDLNAYNDYVYSVMPGHVVKAGKSRTYGNYVEIEHGDFRSLYAHLQNVLVGVKQSVEAGQPIAISGNSGRSTGEHLHFEMKYRNKIIDPAPILSYVYDLIDFTKTELAGQIDRELRRNK